MPTVRVILAGLFVVIGVSVVAGLLLHFLPPSGQTGTIIGIISGLAFLALCIVAFILFDSFKASDVFSNENLDKLEEKGLLVSTEYQATRAFQVEEFEDEGSHYFVELADESVLYLNGQYLYDYESVEDDPEFNQPRLFPCTHFTIRRHKIEGYVAEIQCQGAVIEPEIIAKSFTRAEYHQGIVPEDGDILSENYEMLKARMSARGMSDANQR